MPRLGLVIGFLVLAGIGVSTYHPAAYAAIHDAGHGKGRTYGAFEASGSTAVIGMLVLQGLLIARIGWRGMIVIGAIPGAIMGVLLLAAPRLSFGDVRVQRHPVAGAAPAASVLLSAIFVLGVMLRILGFNALQNFAPTYLVRAVQMDPAVAALAMGVSFRRRPERGPGHGPCSGPYRRIPGLCPVLRAPGAAAVAAQPAPALPWHTRGFSSWWGSAARPATRRRPSFSAGSAAPAGKGSVFGVLMGATALTAAAAPLLFGLVADQSGLVAAVRACGIPVAAGWIVTVFVWRRLSAVKR